MIPVNEPLLAGREAEYVNDCIKTGWISSAGKYIDRFEKGWAEYCGRKYGVAVCNGTAALQLAVSTLELPPGSEVIIPDFTIVSCIEAVLRNGLVPVVLDAGPDTYCMDVSLLESRINSKTSAVMPAHIYGHPVNMAKLLKTASDSNLKIIEDAAEAHGAECKVDGQWRKCGSFGDVSCFSFYANKNISCGEGGMVLTDDEGIYERLKSRRNLCFGSSERFHHEGRGWNYRMTNLQAAVGCAQLEQIDSFIARKLEMAEMYRQGLRGLPLILPEIKPWAKSTVWMYAVRVDDSAGMDAAGVMEALKGMGVGTRPFFRGMHAQEVYRNMGLFANENCPVSDKIYKTGFYLPSGQAVTDSQINKVIDACAAVFN